MYLLYYCECCICKQDHGTPVVGKKEQFIHIDYNRHECTLQDHDKIKNIVKYCYLIMPNWPKSDRQCMANHIFAGGI